MSATSEEREALREVKMPVRYVKMEETIFVKIFGNTPKVRIWDFLLDNDVLDFTKSEIARQTGISRATLNRLWPYLIKNKILVKSRVIGRATLFRLNKENELVKKMLELDNFLVTKDFSKLIKQVRVTA